MSDGTSAAKDEDVSQGKAPLPAEEDKTEGGGTGLLYGLEETPTLYLWLLLSFQQFLMAVTSFIPNPLVMAVPICLADDVTGMGEFLGTVFFVGGVSSLIQTSLGVRLPIIQGPSASFVSPILMLLKTNAAKCPDFDNQVVNSTTHIAPGSEEHREIWKANLVELQGSLMVASLAGLVIGFSGLIGVLMRYIGPLTTATVISLIGLSLTTAAREKGATHWWICFWTIFLITLFSQYLRNVTVNVLGRKMKIFLLFPILLAVVISWLTCLVLTETDVLSDKKGEWGYEARTDIKAEALSNSQWFRFPLPGQWGVPRVTVTGVIAMLAAVFAITIESVGDYHACARLCEAPPPTGSAISRGIGIEAICCVLGGAWGTGSGFTSFSSNIASIGLTKCASRVVVQLAAVMLIVAGCVGKVGAFFSTVPYPILGAMIYCMFGMVTAVGISNLGMVDLNSTRNLFVFGFSMFFALSAPGWVADNPISVGNDTANQVLTVFCSTSMLVGGFIACLLDNTIPGTLEERGIILPADQTNFQADLSSYNLPLIQPFIDRIKCFRYVPICPGFIKDAKSQGQVQGDGRHTDDNDRNIPSRDVTLTVEKSVNGLDNVGFAEDALPARE